MTRFNFTLLLGMLALTACGPLIPQGQPAPRQFVIDSAAGAITPSSGEPLPLSLQIIQPQTAPGLDTERIALRKNGQEVDYYAGARWTGPLSQMVQLQLVEAFEKSHAVTSVGSDQVQFRPDILLSVEIRDFQAEYASDNAAPVAHVRLAARLIKSSNQSIIATQTFDETQQAEANRMQEVVAAYNAAFARASQKLVEQTAQTLAR